MENDKFTEHQVYNVTCLYNDDFDRGFKKFIKYGLFCSRSDKIFSVSMENCQVLVVLRI